MRRPPSTPLPMLFVLGALTAAPGAGAVPGAGGDPFAEAGLDAGEVARLEAGETVVHMAAAGGGATAEGTAWRILEAPADRLRRAVADWGHYAEFFPFVTSSEADERDGRILVRQRVDLPFPWPDRHFTLEASAAAADRALRNPQRSTESGGNAPPPRWRMHWHHVPGSGNVRTQRGEWRLAPLGPRRTLVALHVASDAGGAVPDAIERSALEETLPWALDGLRQQVNRCRYDVPIHPTCAEAPPHPSVRTVAEDRVPQLPAAAAPR